MFKAFVKDINKHHLHYLVLLTGLLIGFVCFFSMAGVKYWQIAAIVFIGLFYFSWGMVHHLLERDWHPKILLEYLFISIIGSLLLLSLILRG